jgi:hypothetical protein
MKMSVREKSELGTSKRCCTLKERGNKLSTLKDHRQCSLVLLVNIVFREGKALRIEEGKVMGSGLF